MSFLWMVICQNWMVIKPHNEYESGKEVRWSTYAYYCALTANVLAGERERCLQVGMDDYIGKPFKREQLRKVLWRWLPEQQAASTVHPMAQSTHLSPDLEEVRTLSQST